MIVPLLSSTRLEGVSVMPFFFLQGEGKDKEVVVLARNVVMHAPSW